MQWHLCYSNIDAYDGLKEANENASGVAGVIELARIFSSYTLQNAKHNSSLTH